MSTRNKEVSTDISNSGFTLITGGAGFVGVNLADRLLSYGKKVLLFDNLSRAGVKNNLDWITNKYGDKLKVMIADIRDRSAVKEAVSQSDMVYHFAAQVAVTSSLEDPFHDFEVNAGGTLNLLECIRHSHHKPPVIFTSTNKVYGDLEDVRMIPNGSRYYPQDKQTRDNGISEIRNLDFHSPYGCTKGLADQYMLDYARTFGLRSVVFRMSCIYGAHQHGNEDQGWVAHFLIRALNGQPISLYGDGMQVRDILFADDLVNAFLLAEKNMHRIGGQAFNIGGGVQNTVSLLELLTIIDQTSDRKPVVNFEKWRPSDQKYYVSDFSKFSEATGWQPQVSVTEGVHKLHTWLRDNLVHKPEKTTGSKQPHRKPVSLETVDK